MKKSNSSILLIVSSVLYAVCSAIVIYMSVILGKLIDSAALNNMDLLLKNIYICFGLAVLYLIIVKFAIALRMMFVQNKMISLKKDGIIKILQTPIKNFLKLDNAFYLNLFTADADSIEEKYFCSIPIIVFYILKLALSVGVLFYINWIIPLAFAAFFLIPMLISQLFNKKLANATKISSQANEDYLFNIKETIDGLETIKLNSNEDIKSEKVYEKIKILQDKKRKTRALSSFIIELSNIASTISQLGCIALGGYLVIKGSITIGSLIVCIELSGGCFGAIEVIGTKLSEVKSMKILLNKYNALKNTDEVPEQKDCIENNQSTIIEYKDVSFAFGENTIIDNYNFSFEKGKNYAIVGPSGSGKSTFVRLMLKYYDNYSGNIIFKGNDISQISDIDLYKTIRYVSQQPYLFNETLIQNITLSQECNSEKLNAIIRKTNLTELVEKYGDNPIGDNGKKISGGERQRISLARALISNPDIIIFDEPTSALDPENVELISKLIIGLDNITCIVITHDQSSDFLVNFDEVLTFASKTND
ncbi:MAG: ABC transporter ATP-binding protein [Oscillospiraceae bacterium]